LHRLPLNPHIADSQVLDVPKELLEQLLPFFLHSHLLKLGLAQNRTASAAILDR